MASSSILDVVEPRQNGDEISGHCSQCSSGRVVQTTSASGGGVYVTEVRCEDCGAEGSISGNATDVRGDTRTGEVFE